jgi:hypothetical protein
MTPFWGVNFVRVNFDLDLDKLFVFLYSMGTLSENIAEAMIFVD